MSERILTILSGVLAGFALPAMAVLFVAIGDLTKRIDAAIEAVAIIEDAAQHIQDDMQILRDIADEQQCYENRGEWTTSHGCVLEEMQ